MIVKIVNSDWFDLFRSLDFVIHNNSLVQSVYSITTYRSNFDINFVIMIWFDSSSSFVLVLV